MARKLSHVIVATAGATKKAGKGCIQPFGVPSAAKWVTILASAGTCPRAMRPATIIRRMKPAEASAALGLTTIIVSYCRR